MSEISKYEAQKKKLGDLCEEHDLTFRFRPDVYPITLTIRPTQGVGEQLSLLGKADGQDYISPDAALTFYRKDGELGQKITGTFTISEALRNKFKNIFVKLADYWQQYFFRSVIENHSLRKGTMPVIDESDANDSDGEPAEEDGEEQYVSDGADPDEALIGEATKVVRHENKATVSLLQRHLKLGYSKAARLMDMLEERGIVGPYRGAEPREVLPCDVPEEG